MTEVNHRPEYPIRTAADKTVDVVENVLDIAVGVGMALLLGSYLVAAVISVMR